MNTNKDRIDLNLDTELMDKITKRIEYLKQSDEEYDKITADYLQAILDVGNIPKKSYKTLKKLLVNE